MTMPPSDYFQIATRTDGTPFTTLSPDAPEWVQTAVYEAHDSELPNDWRYDAARAIFDALQTGDADPDDPVSWADSYTDVYNADLAAWLAADLSRDSYCEDALSEFGAEGLTGAFDLIRRGQYVSLCQMFAIIAQHFSDNADDDDKAVDLEDATP